MILPGGICFLSKVFCIAGHIQRRAGPCYNLIAPVRFCPVPGRGIVLFIRRAERLQDGRRGASQSTMLFIATGVRLAGHSLWPPLGSISRRAALRGYLTGGGCNEARDDGKVGRAPYGGGCASSERVLFAPLSSGALATSLQAPSWPMRPPA